VNVHWLVSLIAAVCVVATGHARPDDAAARRRESTQLVATSGAPVCVTLRPQIPHRPRPALRSWPYDIPAAPVLTPPSRAATCLAPPVAAELVWPAAPAPTSRGPPLG
jgi:hypothetical protein